MKDDLVLSTMAKTWFFDLDGTIVKHNGYKTDGKDTLLSGAKQYLEGLPDCDRVVLVTSRTEEYREETLRFLKENHIRYDEILFNLPMGERIIVNDRKPSGLDMAVALNMERDQFNLPNIVRQK
ncbi:MAG: hypothetical protein K2P71_14170 [Lachnospiraceae bacterium]|jgi:histidinol phosphatase-like enzyme|nr:hypothetical protein [Lachnospiraceae bacterium]